MTRRTLRPPAALRVLALLPLALAACKEGVDAPARPRTPNPQSASVLMQHNDLGRTGWNAHETALTTTTVNAGRFGRLFALEVDDEVWAQPLVVGGVAVPGGARNVVYVATASNTVYAFDGDDGTLYWRKTLTAPGMRPVRRPDMTGACGGFYQDFSANIGIVGTPVIDSAAGVLYVVARSTTGSTFVQHLHALRLIDGGEAAGSPVAIAASVPGTGDGSAGGTVRFDPLRQNQRQGLTLSGGVVYVSFSSHCDWGPYHGWILGYDAGTLQQRVVYNATPDGEAGGMWESGAGMAADAQGNLYVVTGNGTVGAAGDPTNPRNRGTSALKLAPSGGTLSVASFFTPSNYPQLNQADADYGSMGALLVPGSDAYVTGGKDGKLYVLNRHDMGGWSAAGNRARQVLSLGPAATMHAQAAYWGGGAGEFVYVWSENDPLRALPFDRASGALLPGAQVQYTATGPSGNSGAMLSVSSNGTQAGTGIVWASYASIGDAEHGVRPGVLRAFDAADVTRELWSNQQNARRDDAGTYAKFAAPTVANGHVYLPTFSGKVVVYGLLP